MAFIISVLTEQITFVVPPILLKTSFNLFTENIKSLINFKSLLQYICPLVYGSQP